LKENEKFLKDTKEHHEILKYLREHVLNQIDNLTAAQLKERLTGKLMLRVPAIFFSQIDDNLSQVKSFLHFIVDFMKTEGDSLEKLNSLLEENSSLRIKGLGICGISQFLAAAYPNEFIVLEDNISKAIRHLNITDVLVKQDTANAYLYINEICKKMHDEKMKERLKQYDFGLPAVHNFLWHYYKHYLSQGIWY